LLATLVKIDQLIRAAVIPVPHKVVQQPAAKELKKSPKIPFIGLILPPNAS
jgi:hypothetical protein